MSESRQVEPRAGDDTQAFHEFERAGWERVADVYDRYFASLTTRFIPPLLAAAGVAAGSRVLDVATGPGYAAAAAVERGAEAVGIDFAEAAVAVARQRYPALAFHQGSAEELPFPNADFDAVVMNFGLLHLARPEQALIEAHRVLRPGGRIAFSVWAAPDSCLGFKLMLDAIAEHGAMDVALPDGPPFFRFSESTECERALTEAGFSAPTVELVQVAWELPHADTLFKTFYCGAVRTGALLQAQSPAAQAAIRQSVRGGVTALANAGGIRLPMAAVIATGRKD